MNASPVLILMGSDSDLPAMQEVTRALADLGLGYEMHVASAHRSPARVASLAGGARAAGFRVVVAGAGMSAHLAGVVAAHTTLPVIGVPLASTFGGADALLSTVQMPPGVPVATVGIGPAGAYNAGVLAASILSLGDPALAERLEAFRAGLARKVEEKDRALQAKLQAGD